MDKVQLPNAEFPLVIAEQSSLWLMLNHSRKHLLQLTQLTQLLYDGVLKLDFYFR